MPSFRPDDIECTIDRSAIEVASRTRPQLRGKLSAAQTEEKCLNDVFCIREISGHPIRRPMDEIVVLEEQCLEFRGQLGTFQVLTRRNKHEALSSVTPGFGLLLQAGCWNGGNFSGNVLGRESNSHRSIGSSFLTVVPSGTTCTVRRTYVLRTKPFWFGFAICVLVVSSFVAGRAWATQLGQVPVVPRENTAIYTFPRAWGELRSATATARGFAYFFVGDNGSIRVVQIGPGGIEDIQVIGR